jgi:hypothetical protein
VYSDALIFGAGNSYIDRIIAPCVGALGDRERISAPAQLFLRDNAMRKRRQRSTQYRHRFNQLEPLEERLVQHAKRLREEANWLPAGVVREAVIRRAEQAEAGAHMSQWLRLPASESKA